MSAPKTMPIEIGSSYPMRVEVTAEAFGEMFAKMSSDEQVAIMTEIADRMRAFPMQWDYISIELEKPENGETRRAWMQAFQEGPQA